MPPFLSVLLMVREVVSLSGFLSSHGGFSVIWWSKLSCRYINSPVHPNENLTSEIIPQLQLLKNLVCSVDYLKFVE